jgi:cytochrome P450
VKSNKDLDHRELVRQDFYAGFPGFEGLTLLHSDNMLMDVIKTKLGQNDSLMPIMDASVVKALEIHRGNDRVRHTIDWQKDTIGIIAHAASSVFVGPEKSDDAKWLDIVQGYVAAHFAAVGELHGYPAWSKPIVQRFLPNAIACRKYVVRARAIMNEVLGKRRSEVEKAKLEGRPPPEFNDALAWTQSALTGKAESGDVQLSLAMSALFTTSELFRQVLIDLAAHPDLIEPLREEVSQQISTHGVSVAAASAMVLLDSVLKESQRQSAPLGMFSILLICVS